MSTYLQLREFDIIAEIYKRQQEAELFREKEFRAAVKIQSWWRGVRLRSYLTFLHKQATIIQATYRGYTARLQYSDLVDEEVNKMKNKYYGEMATKIQARWRGYHTRKYKHNFKARKQYLEAVLERNSEVREALNHYVEAQREEKEIARRIQEEEEKMLQARRHHYLQSTYQINGVYASSWYPQNEFENRLRSVKPLSKEERAKLFPNKNKNHVELETDQSAHDNKEKTGDLPPLRNPPKKMQGPFRAPGVVRAQRYRSLSPTLRVSTAYDSHIQQRKNESNAEWVKRIQNEPMRANGIPRKSYEPLLHTQSPYGQIPYGSKYFREESNKRVTSPFKSVVPPIPIFDKFGKTFSKGTVY